MSKPPKYFRVSPKLWHEPWNNDERLLAFYLLTCDHRTTEGLFRLPQPYAAADLGWSLKRLQKVWNSLTEAGFISYQDDVVLITKALKWQSPANPNQMKGALRVLETVPETKLDSMFVSLAQRFAEPFAQLLPHRFTQWLPHSPSPSPSPSSTSTSIAVTPPTPPPEGGRNGSRSNGTNPRAVAKKEEIERHRRAIRDCTSETCEHNPDGWASLCATCAHRIRKIGELTNA